MFRPQYAALRSSEDESDGGDGEEYEIAKSPPAAGGRLARLRALEFCVSVAVFVVAGVFSFVPVHWREVPRVEVVISGTQTVWARDPALSSRKRDEQVTTAALVVYTTGVPILANLLINYVAPTFTRVRGIPHDTRDFLLSLTQSVSISQAITQFVKNMAGRLRPCFYDMCKWDYNKVWDGVSNLCQDKVWEKEARLSFPSGHASYAWSTLFLLTLYLLGRSRLNCENRDPSVRGGCRRTLTMFLCLLPTLLATWVTVTRSVDNWHHYGDVFAGSIIGAMAAGFGYRSNYGSIFDAESAGVPHEEAHARRKIRDGRSLHMGHQAPPASRAHYPHESLAMGSNSIAISVR